MASVIVFGPTGNIACVAARTAQQHGATVYLAMRDPTKPIRGLTSEAEQAGGFKRLQADLSDPASVTQAVKTSGATRAFIYRVQGTPDHMRASLSALRDAGIDLVVFLSSYTIRDDPHAIPPTELISFVHAQVEINLSEVFGAGKYVALRAGGFATNLLRYKAGIAAGEVKLHVPAYAFDFIAHTDIGGVVGTILAEGNAQGKTEVYLYGPQIQPQGEAIERVARILGKEGVEVTALGGRDAVEQFVQVGIPRPVAEYIVRKAEEDDGRSLVSYDEGVENVRLYTGKPALGLEEWVEQNKALFSV
ncbi:hypothetical protein BJY01DRAFT_145675 [Aspergillus pseudoustus]|uniref:NmrA-like domain-containing protein n=1 Tax=Aspergillus pseudoustus TaxID=1810923 RepID=A0ABR4IFR2_9EURO